MTETQVALLIVGGTLGLVGFVISLICVAMIAGFTRSTHTVQYMPVDNTDMDKLLEPTEEIAKENEAALLNMVGRKKKKEGPTLVDPLDSPLEEISQSDIHF